MKKTSPSFTPSRARRTARLPSRTPPAGLPFVLVNMAMTADGKIATANRAVISFGSPNDITHLYELRATADAVMAGARTIEEAHAKLGSGGARFECLRLERGLSRFSVRIIVSGSGSIDTTAAIFGHHAGPLIILTTARAPARKLKRLREISDDVLICGKRDIHFVTALKYLRRKWHVKRLLCEGGGELNDALFRAGLVDELHLTVCPKICGGTRAPTISDGLGTDVLAHASNFELKSSKPIGDELFLIFRQSASAGPKAPHHPSLG